MLNLELVGQGAKEKEEDAKVMNFTFTLFQTGIGQI